MARMPGRTPPTATKPRIDNPNGGVEIALRPNGRDSESDLRANPEFAVMFKA